MPSVVFTCCAERPHHAKSMFNTHFSRSRFNILLALAVSLAWSSVTAIPSMAAPMPNLPASAPEDSVPMGPAEQFEEVKLDFPIAAGPFEATWNSIEKNYPGSPKWLRDAKFGIWVHFGPQSAGESGDWYARNLYKPGNIAYQNHLERYGHPSEVGYKEVLRDWNPTKLDPAALTKIYHDAGARFLIVQGVHHDNFDLWASRHQPWNSTRMGPKRDLIAEWAKASRAMGMHYGVTFHHEYTWYWWQSAFGSDQEGPRAGIPYDGHLTLADGKGKWWEGFDPRLLYGIDLREYKGVTDAVNQPWGVPRSGIFSRHLDYAHWYASQWALRIIDVIDQYDPDFIYTDGTSQMPFSGAGTGTGFKCDAMPRVIAHFYNRTLETRGKVDTFSIVKFRSPTNGTVTTEEHGIPANIKTDQPWIAEAPVGDWFYAPGFTYDSGMMIRYIIEAVARDGNAALAVSLLPDGSLDAGSVRMLREVGEWMRVNGDAVYGSHAWSVPGEGEMVAGALKMLPGGKLGKRHAEFLFGPQDFRFVVGRDGALYAFALAVPDPGATVRIKSLGKSSNLLGSPIKKVTLLGHMGRLNWKQAGDRLEISYPTGVSARTAVVFRVTTRLRARS
jgi:alpha-L-fucosidase